MQPYYQDSHVTLYCADNRDVVPQLDARVDLLLTDPPYGVGWETAYARTYHAAAALPGGARPERKNWQAIHEDTAPFEPTPWLTYPQVILWGANCYSDRLPMGRWLVWDRRFKTGKSFKPSHGEVAWQKGGHGVRIFQQVWQGVCRTHEHHTERDQHGGHRSLHPTMKSVALAQWCIAQARRVQTVLDPYAGSGWVLIAAKSLGLRAIGGEIEERYAETAARRLERTHAEEAA